MFFAGAACWPPAYNRRRFDSDLRLQYTLRIRPLLWHYLLTTPLTHHESWFLGNSFFGRFWGIPSVENDPRLCLETKLTVNPSGAVGPFLIKSRSFIVAGNRWRSHIRCKAFEAMHAKREQGLRSRGPLVVVVIVNLL